MKTNIYILYGGRSVEHEVSLKSASFIINSIDKEKYNIYPVYITKEGKWCGLELISKEIEDEKELKCVTSKTVFSSIGEYLVNNLKVDERNIVFPALHGSFGEDGTIQGFLEVLDIPYVGNGVMASAIGIDKCAMRDLFKGLNIPQPKYISISIYDYKKEESYNYKVIKDTIGFPCYIKPARLGSIVGITRCASEDKLKEAISEAFIYDNKLIVEEEIVGREVQVSVLGNESPRTSELGEITQDEPFLDYDIKYTAGRLGHIIPARLDEFVSEELKSLAIKIFKVLNSSGILRVDYFVTDDNKYYLNEVNTMPGFTKLSMVPDLWRNTNNTTALQVVEELIRLGFEIFESKKNTLFSRR